MKTKFPNIETIVGGGMCAGCGLCASLVGDDSLEMKITSAGRIRPVVKKPLLEHSMEQVRAVCPGIRVTGPSPAIAGPKGTMHDVWGPIRTVHRGWAADPDVRFKAAAGGALTALGVFLIESGKVEAVLHVRASTENPMLTDAQISTTADEVISGAQSRYGPAAPLVHVHRLLDEGTRFAVIAKPCDIAAIRNLERIDSRVSEQIPFCLTNFCGGLPSAHTPEKIAGYHGLEPSEVSMFRFRGNGWPGPLHVEDKGGNSYDLTYVQAWDEPGYPWTNDVQFRCKICPDAIGELSDVACPDGWIMEGGKPVFNEAPGVNVVVARTERGEALVAEAAAAGAIELAPYGIDEFDAMHVDHLPRKLGLAARLAGVRFGGAPTPEFRNYRGLRTIIAAGFRRTIDNFLGTRRRVRSGANREPLI
jgi:coenzyme F420 hydrogenase subunit beta